MTITTLDSGQDLARCVENHEIVVVDFWAPWCGTCREIEPVLEAASQRQPDIAFCRANTGTQDEMRQAFDIKVVPTLVVIRDGVVVASQPGALAEETLEELLTQARLLDMEALRRDLGAAPPVTGQPE
jgi:thioredoxin 1